MSNKQLQYAQKMKSSIIDKIRAFVERTGEVPGFGTFAKESGIKESDWKGVFWARWGDAIKEAGFEPNTATKKLSRGQLLEGYCLATRHYQKAPTGSELRMFSKSIERFPSTNTMLKSFGSITNVRLKAREWASENSRYSDVVNFLPKSSENKDVLDGSSTSEGWVYLLKSGIFYKIGRGDDIERRVKQVAVAMPDKVILIHSIKTDDPSGIEAYWHKRFKSKRANGEWFKLNAADVKAMKKRKFQ